MKDNNQTLQSRPVLPAAYIIVMLNLNIYCLFYLVADNLINASLSKSKSSTSVVLLLEKKLRKLFVHKSTDSITYLVQPRKIKHMIIKLPATTVTGVEVASLALINPLSVLSISQQFLTKLVSCCCESAHLEHPSGDHFVSLTTSLCL